MKKILIFLSLIILSGSAIVAQTPSFAIQEKEMEWKEYTSFQRDELIAFCSFLYEEGIYDRALLGYFQFLYKYPGDTLEAVVSFRIARCYDESGNADLAVDYYNRVVKLAPEGSELKQQAWYNIMRVYFDRSEYDTILAMTDKASNPYDLIFRAYVHLYRMEWLEARQAILAAEAKFNSRHYTRLLRPLKQAVDQVGEVPKKRVSMAFMSSIVPGGGFAYLGSWKNAAASMLTFCGISTAAVVYKSENKVLLPLILSGAAVYGVSVYKAVTSVRSTNSNNLQRYINYVISKYPVSRFVDFKEPEII